MKETNPTSVYSRLLRDRKRGYKAVAVLVDPDKTTEDQCDELLTNALLHRIDYFFVGGSLITTDHIHLLVQRLRKQDSIPVLLFPGSNLHIDPQADAILLLSLISGRNPELLIGQHVAAAPILRRSALEVIPTGYLLIDGGRQSAVQYISNTTPIPYEKNTIAVCTAMAGEMLGLKLIYLDAGSGALRTIAPSMILAVRRSIEVPLVVGGGITDAETARKMLEAGADLVVIGNGIEKNPELLSEVSQKVGAMNAALNVHE